MSPSIAFTPWPEHLQQQYRDQGLWTDRPLCDILSDQAQANPNQIALICRNRQYSYYQLDQISTQLANAIIARVYGNNTKQAKTATALVQLPNCAEFYLLFFALLKAGIVPVNALFNHQHQELTSFAAQIEPRLVVLSANHNQVLTEQGKSQLLTKLSPHLAEEHSILWLDEIFMWHHDTNQQTPLCYQNCSIEHLRPTHASQVAFFQLSGGSTGIPKLIPRTHNDYDYSVRQSAKVCRLSTNTRYLMALPAGHNFSLSSPGALGVFEAGGTVIIATDPSPSSCFDLIEQHQVNMTALVPPALALWLNAPVKQQLASLELIQVGGAKLSPSLAQQVKPTLNCQLQQVFGMAEGLVNYTRLDDSDWLCCHSQGSPMSEHDEVLIKDQQGHPVPFGSAGELWTRGPYTFRGYYQRDNNPSFIHNSFDQQGFYASGDIVKQLPSGHLQVVGRVKDQINRGGEKIDAQQVEDVLLQLEQVYQVAIVAKPCEQLTERAVAFVIATSPIRPVQLRRHLRQQGLAEFKFPDQFEFVSTLPKTAVGKIDKLALRQQLQATE